MSEQFHQHSQNSSPKASILRITIRKIPPCSSNLQKWTPSHSNLSKNCRCKCSEILKKRSSRSMKRHFPVLWSLRPLWPSNIELKQFSFRLKLIKWLKKRLLSMISIKNNSIKFSVRKKSLSYFNHHSRIKFKNLILIASSSNSKINRFTKISRKLTLKYYKISPKLQKLLNKRKKSE